MRYLIHLKLAVGRFKCASAYIHTIKATRKHEKCVSIVSVHREPFSGQNALDCMIFHIQSQNFTGGNTQAPQKCPSAWTQTPISAGFASVPIVCVLRND